MPTIATGVFKKLALKKQAGLNQKAAAGAAGSSRYMRRVTSTLDLTKATYQSAEILESQQKRDARHGVRAVAGSISGELSVGGYQLPMESICRQVSAAPLNSGAINTVATVVVGTNGATLTRGAGDWRANLKLGDMVRAAGYTAPALANNGKNLLIIGITALVLTVITMDGSAMVAKVAGDNITISQAGRKTFMPSVGQTRDYYTIEHWFADIAQSEQYRDCVFTGMTVNLPPTGMATIELPVMGLGMDTGIAQYFNAPQAAPAGGILASVNGWLVINGAIAGLVTGLSIVINGNYTVPGGVVGSNEDPDVFPGTLDVTGQLTVLFADATFRDAFLNETESSIIAAFTENNLPAAGFTNFVMSRVKYTGATKNDGNAGLTLTMPYTALENMAGGAALESLQTTLSIQDSAWA